jgi:3-hydroxyisobutyrate dehydrogenase-like beta-hydroxyacid dehydrogenase
MKLGFIGLGHMGAAIVRLLAQGGSNLDWSAISALATQDASDRRSVIKSSNSISN